MNFTEFKKCSLNFIVKFSTLNLTKIRSHFFIVTETLNNDKSDSNQCYSQSVSATAHCSYSSVVSNFRHRPSSQLESSRHCQCQRYSSREAPNALYTLAEREKKSFQVTTKTVSKTRRISKVVW